MTATIVPVDLAGSSYDIRIGAGLLDTVGPAISGLLDRRKLLVLTDETVAKFYLERLTTSCQQAGHSTDAIVLPAGEESKDFRRFPQLVERMLDLEPDRKSVIVALGGGVIGDLAGFAAAVLLRGIQFVQVPTTLLAQIDSSVGGKTGANTRHGKNLVGAFYQPRLVLSDLDALRTLPRRELLAGYAEMVKYGLLGDATFFSWLEQNGAAVLAGDPALLAQAVAHCCRMKAEIVAEDEREAGRRALLNLGHTFGHAFEAETGFGSKLLHGEAVGLGLLLAAKLSRQLQKCSDDEVARIERLLKASGLPVSPSAIEGAPFSADRLIGHMRHDKKASGGELTFIVLEAIGDARVLPRVDEALVREVLLQEGRSSVT